MDYKGKIVFITGGVGGLGKATTKAFLEKGSKVCIGDISEENGIAFVEELAKTYGKDNVMYIQCDVTNEEDYEAVWMACSAKLGDIDIWINNAGIYDERDIRKTFEVNLVGPIIGTEFALKKMGKHHGGKGGNIVNIASLFGIAPVEVGPVYAASKAGILHYTRSIGADIHYNYSGVRIQALCPNVLNTPIIDDVRENYYSDLQNTTTEFLKKLPLMKPETVAAAIFKLIEGERNGAALAVKYNEGSFYVDPPASLF